MPLSGPTGSVLVFHGLTSVSKKPSLKADLVMYSNIVTASGQCLSVAIILSNKWISDFPKSNHIILNAKPQFFSL